MSMASLSCVVIGEGNILLSSLKQLHNFHVDTKAVFSNTDHVHTFCQQQGIAVYRRGASIETHLSMVSFDYLFSINNPRVLKEGELRLARQLAINYHDSPLPAYAGVNASSWAIINGETQHGITLHVIDVGIDTGHVLEKEEVPILPTDSALSLNLRCVDAFQLAFSRLLVKISTSAELRPQVQDNNKRSYYGLYASPPNLGILDFRNDFTSVHNLARALEYGHHENPLGSPKVLTAAGQYLLVTNADKTERETEDTVPSGTIVDIVDDTLIVKTASELILLSVAEIDGGPIRTWKYQQYSLTRGSRLQSFIGAPADNITAVRKKEGFWRRRMQQYEPTMFLRQKLNIGNDILDVSDIVNIKTVNIKATGVPSKIESEDFLLMSSFMAFLARICCTNAIHVGLVADKASIPAEYRGLYSDILPGIFEIDLASTPKIAFTKCFQVLEKYISSHTFLEDMLYRYPELVQRRRETPHNIVVATPDMIARAGGDECIKIVLCECNMFIVLSLQEMKIFYNVKQSREYVHIMDTLKHYPAYVASLCSLSPNDALLDVELLSDEEMALLYPVPTITEKQPDLFSLFERQSRSTPDAVALKTTGGQTTYLELLQNVLNLAEMIENCLPDSYTHEKKCVALHLPNSMGYVLSVLASVRVYCPFLPLPADLPTDRLAFTLRDAKATIMITNESIFNSDKVRDVLTKHTTLFKFPAADTTLIMLQFDIDENDNFSRETDSMGLPDVYSFDSLQLLDCEETPLLMDDCCYVMYTSGSTGKPKGVQVGHASLANLATAQIVAWDLGPDDVTAQFASIGFDASISEIFTALLSGGTLAVLQETERLGKEFVDTLLKLEVSVITLPPSVLNIYDPKDMLTLNKIITAGEACMSQTALKWTSPQSEHQHKNIRFFNAYGPTETTVCSTIYEFQREDYPDIANQELAIGTAIRGVHVYLFDDFLRPVPPEVVGEIYIGGAGVTGGYIGHAANMNQSRFIHNPLLEKNTNCKDIVPLYKDFQGSNVRFALETQYIDVAQLEENMQKSFFSENGKISFCNRNENKVAPPKVNGQTKTFFFNENDKHSCKTGHINETQTPHSSLLYRTGDHAFQDSNGRLTFIGRLDDQVKIRGQRVNLSEIEQVIVQHAKVEMAVVVKHRCQISQEPTIAAFVAPTCVYASELKEYLSRALPKYMIPTYIRKMEVKEFPVTINGKINRKLLETDESVHESQSNVGSSHLNEVQLTMAKLWCQVLSLDESYAYSMHRLSSFSEYGGNSLHLVLMQRVIEEHFHLHISFTDIGAADTIENFTDIIKRRKEMLKASSNTNIDRKDDQRLKILEDSCLSLDEELRQSELINVDETSKHNKDTKQLQILISGVTGFLGAFLLHEILEQTDAQVLCMVREMSETKGMGRVVENLKYYDLWRQSYFPRLAIVLSDVSEPRLGIAPDIYHALCLAVDVVFVNAAKMNFNTCYDDHRQANVVGTRDFIRFCLTDRKKFLFLTSSLSVLLFPPEPEAGQPLHPLMRESDMFSDPLLLEGGYAQSKWASERLVQQALPHLPGGAIFRPARVSGRSTDGVGAKNDLFASLLIGLQDMGCYPDLSFPFDLTPVDFCAKAMIEITKKCIETSPQTRLDSLLGDLDDDQKPTPMPRVYHLFNKATIPFKSLFNGTGLRSVPMEEWKKELCTLKDNQLLIPFTPFLLSAFWERAGHWPVFDTSNTDRFVSAETQGLMKPTGELLPVYRRFFNL